MTREATALLLLPWKKEISTPAIKRGLVLRVSSVKIRRFLRESCSEHQRLRVACCSGEKGFDFEYWVFEGDMVLDKSRR